MSAKTNAPEPIWPAPQGAGENDGGLAKAPPVFEGLELGGMGAREIAAVCGVSVETAASWRRGHARAPTGRVIFLTYLLAEIVDHLARIYSRSTPQAKAWHVHMQASLDGAHRTLKAQEAINEDAPQGARRQGERLFAEWRARDDAEATAAEAAIRVANGADTTGLAL